MADIKRQFVGVYQKRGRPQSRIPIFRVGDRHIDLLGNPADPSKMVLLEVA